MAENVDEDPILEAIYRTAALKAGISVERAKSILEKAGFLAQGNAEIDEALKIVLTALEPSESLIERE